MTEADSGVAPGAQPEVPPEALTGESLADMAVLREYFSEESLTLLGTDRALALKAQKDDLERRMQANEVLKSGQLPPVEPSLIMGIMRESSDLAPGLTEIAQKASELANLTGPHVRAYEGSAGVLFDLYSQHKANPTLLSVAELAADIEYIVDHQTESSELLGTLEKVREVLRAADPDHPSYPEAVARYNQLLDEVTAPPADSQAVRCYLNAVLLMTKFAQLEARGGTRLDIINRFLLEGSDPKHDRPPDDPASPARKFGTLTELRQHQLRILNASKQPNPYPRLTELYLEQKSDAEEPYEVRLDAYLDYGTQTLRTVETTLQYMAIEAAANIDPTQFPYTIFDFDDPVMLGALENMELLDRITVLNNFRKQLRHYFTTSHSSLDYSSIRARWDEEESERVWQLQLAGIRDRTRVVLSEQIRAYLNESISRNKVIDVMKGRKPRSDEIAETAHDALYEVRDASGERIFSATEVALLSVIASGRWTEFQQLQRRLKAEHRQLGTLAERAQCTPTVDSHPFSQIGRFDPITVLMTIKHKVDRHTPEQSIDVLGGRAALITEAIDELTQSTD